MALLILVTFALITIVAVAILNVFVFSRLRQVGAQPAQPFISVMIPARNEARVIGGTVSMLLAQNYPRFEVIVLDDGSTDGTGKQALAVGEGDGRLRVMAGEALPAGWLGKNWACQQMAEIAQGDILLFTDADVRWEPGALQAIANMVDRTGSDLLTVWPTQHTQTWGERLVVPLMALAILGYLPLPLVHHTRWSVFAAANGQCMVFKRAAYERSGGHAGVRGQIVEDVALAKRIKQAGLTLRMADGAGLVQCRMYEGWPAVRDGFAKNILAGHGNSLALLALSAVFHWLVFVLPFVWLVTGWPDESRLWSLALIVLGGGVRMLSAAATRQRLLDAVLMPVSVALMSVIALQSVWWRLRYGGPRWKDRTITREAAHG